MESWMKVRSEVDPDGMFVGEWHRRHLPLELGQESETPGAELPLLEREQERRRVGMSGVGDGVEWVGDRRWQVQDQAQRHSFDTLDMEKSVYPLPPDHSPSTATSEESFDLLARGEASILLPDGPGV
jgi:D-arabinono-1,4-lactone oxidase